MSLYNETIDYYAKNPFNKFELEDYTVSYSEENRICGDNIKVFLKIEDYKVIDWSFVGETTIITTACASMVGESIIGMDIEEVLKLDYEYIKELIGMDVTKRRRNASVFGLLATRNAIHNYKKDNKLDDFNDLF